MKVCTKQQTGFTLLEVLIAVAVFSIGLLGLAGMQLTSLRLNHEAKLRSSASFLAADMADRMRSNINEVNLGITSTYNNPNGSQTGNPNCNGVDASNTPSPNVCNQTQMALHDFYEWNGALGGMAAQSWHAAVDAMLPGGAGIVCIDSTPNDGANAANPACDNIIAVAGTPIYAIKIWWNERDNTGGTVTQRYVTSFQP